MGLEPKTLGMWYEGLSQLHSGAPRPLGGDLLSCLTGETKCRAQHKHWSAGGNRSEAKERKRGREGPVDEPDVLTVQRANRGAMAKSAPKAGSGPRLQGARCADTG